MDRPIGIDKARSVLILTAVLVMIVTWGIGATGWTKGLGIVTFVGLGSVIISVMLARSILPGAVAHLFSLIIGIGWSFWVTSRLLPSTYTWLERWQNLAFRLQSWYERAMEGGTSYDNLMFIFQMGVIIWVTGYLMVWFLFRSGKVWPAVVPGGLVLLINLYYAPNDISFWFIVYLMVSLLLVVRFNLFSQQNKWRAEGVFFRPDISLDFLRDGFIFSALIIAFAWFTPPVVDAKTLGLFDDFEGSWRDMQGEWNRLFADLNYRDRQVFDSFGSSLKLGGPRQLTNDPVMDVKVEGLGRYWRAVVYDYYSGDGWLTRNEDRANFGAGDKVTLPIFEAREVITQTYTYYRNGSTVIYAMANPIDLDRSAKATFSALPDVDTAKTLSPNWSEVAEPWAEEITYIRSNATMDQDESYQVVSAVSQATINQLQNAGNEYPTWITERYLQLPDSITRRTRDLAAELTEPYNNNFDKTRAIERYLRQELTYNEGISAPPVGVDKVDYILFNAKEAYCDYYATSMIVMLRSLGIPARLAAGFARGAFDSKTNVYHVLNKDAHSWVEVYFPRYGWIEFEPTASQPNIIRPTSPEDENSFSSRALPANTQPDLEDNFPGGQGDNIPIDEEAFAGGAPFAFNIPFLGTQIRVSRSTINGSAMVVGLIVVAGVVASGLWWRNQTQIKPGESVISLYARMIKIAGWMGLAMRPWQTPYEQAALLQRSLPTCQREIYSITNEYVYQTFSRHKNSAGPEPSSYKSNQMYTSYAAWYRLRPMMLRSAMRKRLPRWLRK